MVSEKLIKRRIKSAGNIAQITRAMQMVAASKMKKAQAAAVSGRPYAEKIAEMVADFTARIDSGTHPLLKKNLSGKTLVILVTTNKGLCGGLNTNLFRLLGQWQKQPSAADFAFVTLGKKGEQFTVRMGKNLIADFSAIVPFTLSIPSLTTLITDGYLKGEYKEVYISYNNFISALRQEPTRKKILPIDGFITNEKNMDRQGKLLDFLVEPQLSTIIDPLLFHYLENQVRDAVLEAEASEQSARMMAMKNATDSARELIDFLTLEYNKARQEKITYEIADMITARMAVD